MGKAQSNRQKKGSDQSHICEIKKKFSHAINNFVFRFFFSHKHSAMLIKILQHMEYLGYLTGNKATFEKIVIYFPEYQQ